MLALRAVRLFRPVTARSGQHLVGKASAEVADAGQERLDPKELDFLSREEITAQDVHDRLQLICPTYATQPDWKQLAMKYPAVFYRKSPTIKQLLNLLCQDGFITDRSVILRNLWVLLFAPPVLKDKILSIRVLAESDFTEAPVEDEPPLPDSFKVCLTPFSERVIFWLMGRYKINKKTDSLEKLHNFNERVEYLADKLNVFPFEIIEQLELNNMHRLILRSQEQLDALMQVYANIGFQATDLRNHMWLLTRTASGLKPRIQMLQEHKVKITPWMLSAPASELDRVKQQAKIVNEFQTVPNILMKKLNIDFDSAKSLMVKNQQLENSKMVVHLAEVIDFLLSEGLSQEEIAECPKALTMPFSKLKTRVAELKSLNCSHLLPHVHESQYNFDRLIDLVIKSKGEDDE